VRLRALVAATATLVALIANERAAVAEEPALRSEVTGTNTALTVAAGASSLKLLDLPFVGGHALAGISTEVAAHFSLGVDAEYVRASSPNGLLIQVGRFDLTPTFVLDRFRIGVGVDVDWLGIRRETGGDAITHLGFGVHARASFDVVRLGARGGMFVSLEPSYGSFGSPALYGANVSLGARF
jgi:hypothetical protein